MVLLNYVLRIKSIRDAHLSSIAFDNKNPEPVTVIYEAAALAVNQVISLIGSIYFSTNNANSIAYCCTNYYTHRNA